MVDWSPRRVEVGGIRLTVYRAGNGRPPLVFAHGLTDSGLCWSRLAEQFVPEHDVVLYDARGHGLSDHAASYSYRSHVADLVGLLDALRVPPAVLVGHSMGGAHVAAVAAAHPHRVGGSS